MFTFHFTNFAGRLDIQSPSHEGIPNDSPLIIFYKEDAHISKLEILKRFYKLLKDDGISYLRPGSLITQEWLFDLKEFKHSFKCLKNTSYLDETITIEPEYIQNIEYLKDKQETSIKISVYREDINLIKTSESQFPKNLSDSFKKFKKDYPEGKKCGFLMMKFEDTKIQNEIVDIIKSHFAKKGITLLRADDKWYSQDLFENIKTYMQGCSFGIALLERLNSDVFNPNVSLEIGYMMALEKPVLLLKDKTLKALQTDLVGKLYHQFDFQIPQETIPKVLDKWISDMEI